MKTLDNLTQAERSQLYTFALFDPHGRELAESIAAHERNAAQSRKALEINREVGGHTDSRYITTASARLEAEERLRDEAMSELIRKATQEK